MSDGIKPERKVLVTGGAGYIGSHTCKMLASSGVAPIAYDDLSSGHAFASAWGPLVIGDIADTGKLADTVREHRISSAIHFAASAYVRESFVDPRKYFRNNLIKAVAMLDCLLDHGVNKIILSSTCATYGIPEKLPITEDHPQRPINPYGDSKLALEKVLQWYGHAYGLKWVSLRYFNAAGADPDAELGECHREETHLIPLAIKAAHNPEPPLRIFGTDYPTRDGTAIRDYIHVTDLAHAHVLALNYLEDGNQSRAFNLGTGNGYSVAEVVAAVEGTVGRAVHVEEVPRQPGDPAELIADARLARQELGWIPEHSSLNEIISTAWKWERRSQQDHAGHLAASI